MLMTGLLSFLIMEGGGVTDVLLFHLGCFLQDLSFSPSVFSQDEKPQDQHARAEKGWEAGEGVGGGGGGGGVGMTLT